jgi:hypothetical protein
MGPDMAQPLFFICSRPETTPGFWDGWDILFFFFFSALGLRISLFDFFWPFAMMLSFAQAECPNADARRFGGEKRAGSALAESGRARR